MFKSSFLRRAAVAAVLPSLGGCAWIGLAWGALTYPVTEPGEAANVAAGGDLAYVTRGTAGIEILHLDGEARSELMPLPAGVDSADDLALADGLMFVLDAQAPGHLSVFSLADPAAPVLAAGPVPVDVGPFSGVAAAAGRVVVSGGTSLLSLRSYDAKGRLSGVLASADFGRGQPDVELAPNGFAFISTHEWGPHFRITLGSTTLAPPAVTQTGVLPLSTYGFTPGGAKPANFPVAAASAGELLYVASADGLSIANVADPAAPRWLSRLDPDVQPVDVAVRDGIVAVVGSHPRPALVLIDVRDPSHPEILQSFPLPPGGLATGVALTASHVVVAAHRQGALLFNRASSAWERVARHFPDPVPSKESQS